MKKFYNIRATSVSLPIPLHDTVKLQSKICIENSVDLDQMASSGESSCWLLQASTLGYASQLYVGSYVKQCVYV